MITEELSQLLRDCIRTLNNLNVDSGTLIDRLKEAIRSMSIEDESNKLRQS